ncbi:hypothetical protein STENM223S_01316 [Streptomyces tendae]
MNRLWPAVARVTDSALGPYQTAVLRIGVALTWLLFLLREYPHRQELYGPDSPWSWDLAAQLVGANDAFTVLLWSDSQVWFEAVYALAVLFSLLLLLGWRTRTMTALFMVGVLSLQNRSVFMGDGGDNVLHLMAIYLLFTRCGHVWSLDARRARRAARARARGSGHTTQWAPRCGRCSVSCCSSALWRAGRTATGSYPRCCGRCGSGRRGGGWPDVWRGRTSRGSCWTWWGTSRTTVRCW